MNYYKVIIITCFLSALVSLEAQKKSHSCEKNAEKWTVYNRQVDYQNEVIHLNASPGDGILWLNEANLENGTIELDIKGNNTPGRSFVGVAFHGKDSATYDAIYFRPFNFQNLNRNKHSVQYISMPENNWSTLRNAFPGKYENTINPIPDVVDDWFHVKIEVNFPLVNVYVNGAEEQTLSVKQISSRKEGRIGLWVGNNSEGWFRNFTISNESE